MVARAEADALDAIADEQDGRMQRTFGAVQQAADGLGAPALVTGLLGAAGGLFVPSPGTRRKLEQAEAKGRETK